MVPYQSSPQNSQIVLANQLDNFKKTTEGSMQAMRNHITNLKAEIRSEVHATLQNQINSLKGDNSPSSNEPFKETRLPYPSRVEREKKDSNDKVQIQKFWEMFKKIHVDITLADALILMPKKDVCEPESNDDSTTSAIVDEFESLLGDIIKQKEELKGISDPVARRRACFARLDKCKIIARERDSFTMGNEDLNFVPNKELDKEILIPIPRESKIGKDCDFPSCDDFQSFKTFSNPLFEKQDDFPSRNDESILKEETFKSYLNPLFEKDEEIISNEASSIISPKIDVKTIVSFFAPIGNCVRKWATSEVEKDNVEVNHEVFKSDSENSLGIHDDKEEEIAFLDGLLEDENFFEMNDKKVESFERKTKEDFETKVEPEKKKELQGKIFDPGITFHGKSFEKDVFENKSSKELAPSKALLTLDVFRFFRILDASGSNMWRDQIAIRNFIDGLNFSS
ncbi:hypothetical protein Tco_0626147 [Tanacetum coccineum]|uniref:Uncharacterized protein n=1 Tax=Tanacetum coccineum TaxID=301880 RepID=A0ABQ4WIS4_9ASTR